MLVIKFSCFSYNKFLRRFNVWIKIYENEVNNYLWWNEFEWIYFDGRFW